MVEQDSLFTGASGTRDERYDEYLLWIGSRTAVDFVDYIKNVRGVIKLSHSGILKDAGISDSLARSNPFIKKHLVDMEKELIRLGYLPDPDEQWSNETPEKTNKPTKLSRSARDKRRIEELEQNVARLKIERDDAREALGRYGMLEQYMTDTMRFPR